MKNFTSQTRYFTLFCFLLFTTCMNLHAQDAKQEVKIKERIEILKKDLGVNEEVAQKIINLEKEMRLKMEELKKNTHGDREAMKPGLEAMKKEKDQKLGAMLNKQQIEKYNVVVNNDKGKEEGAAPAKKGK